MAFPAIAAAAPSVIGSVFDAAFGKASSKKDWKRQLHMAQNQIQYRVADAKAAGIHPLYALGATPQNYSSTMAGGSTFGEAGQDISRAVMARQSEKERAMEVAAANERANRQEERETARTRAEIGRTDAETALIKAQLARMVGSPPPAGGRASEQNVHRVRPVPSEPIMQTSPGSGIQAGNPGSTQLYREPNGGLSVMPSEQAKQAMEDSAILEVEWWLRNRLSGYLGGTPSARPGADNAPPPGYEHHWDWGTQTYRLRPIRRRRPARRPDTFSNARRRFQ